MSEKVKRYRHPDPGYRLTLFNEDGTALKTKAGKGTALFTDTGVGIDRCGVRGTKDETEQKAIERSKRFKSGVITVILSDDDIKAETKKKEQSVFLEKVKDMAVDNIFDFEELKKKKKDQIYNFADKIGVVTQTDKGERIKAEVLADIQAAVFGTVDENPETEGKDKESQE